MQRRGRARISRPESGGDCYFSAKWGQLAVHHYRVELSGDSPTRGRPMSALYPKADKRAPISLSLLCDTSGLMHRNKIGVLFDHLVGAGEQRWRHPEAERLRSDQVDD
jgi:hypothetical protein